MLSNTELFKKIDIVEPLLKEIFYMILLEIEKNRELYADKSDFSELKSLIKELTRAQVNTEANVRELSELQKETQTSVKELAEAQKRTEIKMEKLSGKVEELVEVQKKSEIVARELAEAQRKTEDKMEKTRQEVGGMPHSIGFSLENQAFKYLPSVLKRDKDIEVKGRLIRKYYVYFDGTEEQIDVYGEGINKDGNKIYIIGEGKSQLGKKDIIKFLKKIERLKKEIREEIFPLMLTHIVTPEVERFLEEKHVSCYFSYEFES
ncbi:MAG: hypothetical protein ABRQ39_29685 [Candidatus Eremiobacterota bacterium]